MKEVYIEPRPLRSSGIPLEYHVVECPGSDQYLAKFRTQEEAIAWAQEHGYTYHIGRERYTKPYPHNPAHFRSSK